MTTPEDEARIERWRLWIRARAAEHGFDFPPYGQKLATKSGALTGFSKLVGKGPTTVIRWFDVPPSDEGCRAIAGSLQIPQSEVFAAAYGTDDSARALIPAGQVIVTDPVARMVQDLLSDDRLPQGYRDELRRIVQSAARLAPKADTSDSGSRKRRAAG